MDCGDCGCQDAHTPEVLQGLASLEYLYNHAFLAKVALWTDRLLQHWPIAVVPKQWHFYRDQIKPMLKHPSERVIIIISDALPKKRRPGCMTGGIPPISM